MKGNVPVTERKRPETAPTHIEPRIDYRSISRDAIRGLEQIEVYLRHSDLDTRLLDLVRLRASQINGCAYCMDMHTKDLRAGGESEQRLYTLSAWRETPFFTERERAALAWTEAVTEVFRDHVPDDVYEFARRQFGEQELVDLTLAVVAINGWNRLAISFRAEPGTYKVSEARRTQKLPMAV